MKQFKDYIVEYEIHHDGHGNYRDDEGNTWTSRTGGAHRSSFGRRHTITSHEPDHPHAVHINGKKWKSFGSRSHAQNVANKIKGATVHREEVELDEAVDPSEIAGNPKMYSVDDVKKAYYHKKASASDKESLARHLDRYHGAKEWRKPVKEDAEQIDEISDKTLMSYAQKVHDDSLKHDKDPSKRSAAKRNKSVMGFSRAINKLESRPHKESTDMCNVCGQTPCNCTHISESYEQAEEHKNKASKALETSDMESYHHHMSQHHEHMGQWHESKGRHSAADREYAKAEEHHEKGINASKSTSRSVKSTNEEAQINELSSELLARYKEKAGAAATAADKAKKYDLGHKRFKGILKATFKQFANDAKK